MASPILHGIANTPSLYLLVLLFLELWPETLQLPATFAGNARGVYDEQQFTALWVLAVLYCNIGRKE